MTGLAPAKAAQFFRHAPTSAAAYADELALPAPPPFVSAQHTTRSSGIQALLPGAAIDDYVFEPCGYSMNGVEGPTFSTIHITPELGFSYASFEVCGYAPEDINAGGCVG